MGFTAAHVPELIRMVTDPALNELPSDDPAIWAPLHAWRALGQLRAVEAIEPLMSILRRIEEEGDEWVGEELPVVFGMIGIAALEPLKRYAADGQNLDFARVAALNGIQHIGTAREHRDACAAALGELLDRPGMTNEVINACLIASLCELSAKQQVEAIERAFEQGRVDEQICGTVQSIRAQLGLASPPPRSVRFCDEEIERAIDRILPPRAPTPTPDWMKDFLA
jgi:hypothetical protein